MYTAWVEQTQKNHPLWFPYFQNAKLRHEDLGWLFHGMKTMAFPWWVGSFGRLQCKHPSRPFTLKMSYPPRGKWRGRTTRRSYKANPWIGPLLTLLTWLSFYQPTPTGCRTIDVTWRNSSVQTLPRSRELSRAAQAFLGLPSSVQNSEV